MNADTLPLYESPAADRYRAAARLAYALASSVQAVRAEVATKEHVIELLAALGPFNHETINALAAATLAEAHAEAAIGLLTKATADYEATHVRVTI